MSIVNATVLLNGATATFSGGSLKTFTPDGTTIENGIRIADASVTDFRVRPSITLRNRNPQLTNGPIPKWTKDKKSLVYQIPFLTASGEIAFNTLRIEREIHPETTAAAAHDFNAVGAQILLDLDFTSYWASGSLA